jgi:hypothetical protein
MKLLNPFVISARLAPALPIGKGAFLSFVDGQFVLDLPDGAEHVVKGLRAPNCKSEGSTPESELQDAFRAVVTFLSACAESRAYATRQGDKPSEGENSDLFPENVGEWCESVSDELAMLSIELEETEGLISRD